MTPRSHAVLVHEAHLRAGVGAWFTGRVPEGHADHDLLDAGNLAHRRPHRPAALARARAAVGEATGASPERWHLMHQVHGAEVAQVDASTPVGAELRGVDALVSDQLDRPLVVQVADCVPILLAGERTVGAVHAGRGGVALGVVSAALAALQRLEGQEARVHAAVGPAIGGCCYEVPEALREEVAAVAPAAWATTTWGTPSLDLPAAVTHQLEALGTQVVDRVGGCTRCDTDRRWFSHRREPAAGRQVGIVVRPGGERR